jgi:DNA polymerase III epsilon subunit-like protein
MHCHHAMDGFDALKKEREGLHASFRTTDPNVLDVMAEHYPWMVLKIQRVWVGTRQTKVKPIVVEILKQNLSNPTKMASTLRAFKSHYFTQVQLESESFFAFVGGTQPLCPDYSALSEDDIRAACLTAAANTRLRLGAQVKVHHMFSNANAKPSPPPPAKMQHPPVALRLGEYGMKVVGHKWVREVVKAQYAHTRDYNLRVRGEMTFDDIVKGDHTRKLNESGELVGGVTIARSRWDGINQFGQPSMLNNFVATEALDDPALLLAVENDWARKRYYNMPEPWSLFFNDKAGDRGACVSTFRLNPLPNVSGWWDQTSELASAAAATTATTAAMDADSQQPTPAPPPAAPSTVASAESCHPGCYNHLSRSEYVCIGVDFETTGFSPKADRVIQFGAAETDSGSSQPFCELVATKVRIHPDASKVHGIKLQDLAAAENFKSVFARFLLWLDNARGQKKVVFVAHRGFQFDYKFLLFEMRENKIPLMELQSRGCLFADTLEAARNSLHGLPGGYSLPIVFNFVMKKPLQGHHDAAKDALAALQILQNHQLVRNETNFKNLSDMTRLCSLPDPECAFHAPPETGVSMGQEYELNPPAPAVDLGHVVEPAVLDADDDLDADDFEADGLELLMAQHSSAGRRRAGCSGRAFNS